MPTLCEADPTTQAESHHIHCAHCEQGSDRCECTGCDECETIFDSTDEMDACGTCDLCSDCCDCWHCNGCDSTQASDANQCPACDLCSDCCDCSSVRFNPRKPEWRDSATFHENPSRRHISVEIECSACDGFDAVNEACERHDVAVVEDSTPPRGSVKFELNTSPTNGDAFLDTIGEICDALAEDGADVSRSCGLHVHVDARDYAFTNMKSLVALYARIEDALFSVVAPSRRDNHYCTRCGADFLARSRGEHDPETSFAKSTYGENAGKDTLARARSNKYHEARYAALNLHSWAYRGSIECRLHHGTVNPEHIRNWAMLWAGIVDAAKSVTVDEVNAMPVDPWECLMLVAPTTAVRAWLDRRRARFDR